LFKFNGDHPGVLPILSEFLPYSTIPGGKNIRYIPANRITVIDQVFKNDIQEFAYEQVPVGIDLAF